MGKKIRIGSPGHSFVFVDKLTETISAEIRDPAAVAEVDRLLDRHTGAEVVTMVATLRVRFDQSQGSSTTGLRHVDWLGGQPVPLRAPGGVALTHRDQ